MGDENQPHAGLLLELLEQGHDLGLNGDVEGRRRLVGDEHPGVERDRYCNHDALTHTARELVRVVGGTFLGSGNMHPLHEADRLRHRIRAVHTAVNTEHFGDLPSDREYRVQRRQRVLEDHRDVLATDLTTFLFRHRQQVYPAVLNPPASDLGWRGFEDAHNCLCSHRFTRP